MILTTMHYSIVLLSRTSLLSQLPSTDGQLYLLPDALMQARSISQDEQDLQEHKDRSHQKGLQEIIKESR